MLTGWPSGPWIPVWQIHGTSNAINNKMISWVIGGGYLLFSLLELRAILGDFVAVVSSFFLYCRNPHLPFSVKGELSEEVDNN